MDEAGKRVSWVELYLDLVFVLAIGELAHLIVGEPQLHMVWITLGLFVALWWTWVGFAVLYNRHGADKPEQRLLFLAASVPAGVAAVAVQLASTGHSTAFALSLAATRVVLLISHAGEDASGGTAAELLRRRTTRAYAISAVLFLAAIWVPAPYRYVLWGVAIAQESRAMLTEDRDALRLARANRDLSVLAPSDPAEALDPYHFAERFGLFVIILLGEVVVDSGEGALGGEGHGPPAWAALAAAMVLAGALWWGYFDSAAELNLRVLRLSGGSPSAARAIFAAGHMVPAFALLMTAAGVRLLLGHDVPRLAYWLPCVGIGMYLSGTRVFLRVRRRWSGASRVALLLATLAFGTLDRVLSPHHYLWALAALAVISVGVYTASADRAPEDPPR